MCYFPCLGCDEQIETSGNCDCDNKLYFDYQFCTHCKANALSFDSDGFAVHNGPSAQDKETFAWAIDIMDGVE